MIEIERRSHPESSVEPFFLFPLDLKKKREERIGKRENFRWKPISLMKPAPQSLIWSVSEGVRPPLISVHTPWLNAHACLPSPVCCEGGSPAWLFLAQAWGQNLSSVGLESKCQRKSLISSQTRPRSVLGKKGKNC